MLDSYKNIYFTVFTFLMCKINGMGRKSGKVFYSLSKKQVKIDLFTLLVKLIYYMVITNYVLVLKANKVHLMHQALQLGRIFTS